MKRTLAVNELPKFDDCHFLNRHIEYCLEDAMVTFDYGVQGVGACQRHIGPVALWCMGKERGDQPVSSVTVMPTWRFRELRGAL